MRKLSYRLQQRIKNTDFTILFQILAAYGVITGVSLLGNGGNDFNEYCNIRQAHNRIHSVLIKGEAPVRIASCWLFQSYEGQQ